ncbi:ABC transporter ATP-binding protein [Alicyclobacillus mengziensis]|uniref:ABC transporter ATP-binding protein n=1 Tax=Alicyclobacillus mengziensis TaxID=2931921 RepID=A0A9X7Z6F5_9BACL|nr:ABC transporter ATP-binding protein [Alicyclobacillus mengziensis]QSO46158.1 ABC transporter ATP-binding protein [Alicyclobacillus mengziensis]
MISTQNLCKKYGKNIVVNGLNLNVRQGTVYGIVGENGAGKTTALSMLVTLTTPSSGKAYINGFEVTHEPVGVRRSIGYMPDAFGVFDDIRCEEYLLFYADCYKVPRDVARRRCDEYLEWVGLTEKRDAYVNTLSRGMQQRLEVARCLMHDPPVLLLDEPASGLDPRSRIELRSVLQRLKEMGKTILMTSHILTELVEVADEIGIMRAGEMMAVASVNVLKNHTTAYRTLHIVGTGPRASFEAALRGDAHVLNYHLQKDYVEVFYGGTVDQQACLLDSLIRHGVSVRQFFEHETNVEELFLRLTDTSMAEDWLKQKAVVTS